MGSDTIRPCRVNLGRRCNLAGVLRAPEDVRVTRTQTLGEIEYVLECCSVSCHRVGGSVIQSRTSRSWLLVQGTSSGGAPLPNKACGERLSPHRSGIGKSWGMNVAVPNGRMCGGEVEHGEGPKKSNHKPRHRILRRARRC